MPTEPTYPDVVAYETKRAQVKNYYTTRLKALSATDPEYGRLWDERIEALRALAQSYGVPEGA